MLAELDAAAVRRWCTSGLEAITAARQELDDLNVYPVPDGDTGSNLQLTMTAVVEAIAAAPTDMAGTTKAMAHGALMGARGNSGVILSQLLRGVTEVFAPLDAAGPAEFARALTRAAELAYAAVAIPVEGTLLTVARQTAEAVQARYAVPGARLGALVTVAREAAAASLARTQDLLPQLRAAGLVDAGGRGLCVLLEALESVVTGRAVAPPPGLLVARDRSGLAAAREAGSDAFAYEVQFLLRDASAGAVGILTKVLGSLGDSLVVVGGDGLHHVHVHVNDVGAAVEAGVEAGRPFRIRVTRFADQLLAEAGPVPNERRAVVAVASGVGLAGLFRAGGALVVDGGPTANPSTAELLDAAHRTGAREVVLLPNDGNVRAVADAAARAARDLGLIVAVVPTRSALQGLAALSVATAGAAFDDDVAAMAAAAAGTRWAAVTRAVRGAPTPAGRCAVGDVLGLLEGEVVVVGGDLEQVGCELLHRMLLGGGEQVTLVCGMDAADGAGDRLSSYVRDTHPGVEVLAYDGGQPHCPLLLGVE